MYLMRKDYKSIVNLQNCKSIDIEPFEDYSDGEKLFAINVSVENHIIWMGNYKSMQEAQEALAEIMKKLEVGIRCCVMP